jgi:hypothetical protein
MAAIRRLIGSWEQLRYAPPGLVRVKCRHYLGEGAGRRAEVLLVSDSIVIHKEGFDA